MLPGMMTSRRLLTAVMLLIAAFGCSKDETPASPTTPSCTVAAGAISASTFAAGGGTGTVPVTAGTGCTWTATSSATFVTISSGASGTGSGTVSFTVAANTGAARTATLAVAGTSFTISQSAAGGGGTPGSFSAPTATSPIGGQQITVARPPLTVSNATPTGTVGAVTYRFEISDQPTFPNDPVRTFSVDGVAQTPNTTTGIVPRDLGPDVLWYWHARATDGTVVGAYSATETFRTPTTCAFSVSPATASVSGSGGTLAFTVTTASTCAWTAASNSAFVTVSAGASGTGNGTVTVDGGGEHGGRANGNAHDCRTNGDDQSERDVRHFREFRAVRSRPLDKPDHRVPHHERDCDDVHAAVVFDSARHEFARLLLVDRAMDRRHRPDAHPGWGEHRVLLHVDLWRARQHR